MITDRWQHRRVLVVEDEVSIGAICRRVLGAAGLEVAVAADGGTAKEMIQLHRYDLYLVDLRLPVLSGRELYSWLTSEYPEHSTRVLFMTGSTVSDPTAQFLESTGRPVLLKPFSVHQLESMVEETLHRLYGGQESEQHTDR